jgi:hypothetical protein
VNDVAVLLRRLLGDPAERLIAAVFDRMAAHARSMVPNVKRPRLATAAGTQTRIGRHVEAIVPEGGI